MTESLLDESDPTELNIDTRLAVRVPPTQQAFLITDADWNRIKDSISSIRSIESLWFTAAFSCLTFGVSFLVGLIALEQQSAVAFGFRASFLALTTGGFVASLICFIAYGIERRRRKEQAATAIMYMNQIETNLTQSQGP